MPAHTVPARRIAGQPRHRYTLIKTVADREQEHSYDDPCPPFPGIIAPEMTVSYGTSDDDHQCDDDGPYHEYRYKHYDLIKPV